MYLARLALVAAVMLGGCARLGFGDVAPDASSDTNAPPDLQADRDAPSPDAAGGQRWRALGSSAEGSGVTGRVGNAGLSRMAVGPDGQLYVAWADLHLGARQVYVRAWRDDRWQDLAGSSHGAGISATTGESRLGEIDVLSDGQPVVVWFDHGPTRRVMLRHFDGTSWAAMGSSASASGISGNVNAWWPSLAIDGAGRVNVVWEQYWGTTGVRLRRFEGGAWSAVGTSMTPGVSCDDGGQTAQLAAYGDQLHVLWRVQGANELRYRRYDGTRWLPTETPRPAGEALGGGSLSVDRGGKPWIAGRASSGDVVLLRRDVTGWALAARLVPPAKTSAPSGASVAFSTTGVFLCSRLTDRLGPNVYLFQLQGDALVPVASPVPGGVSQSTSDTREATLGAHESRLYLKWEQRLTSGWTIYLRYLDL